MGVKRLELSVPLTLALLSSTTTMSSASSSFFCFFC